MKTLSWLTASCAGAFLLATAHAAAADGLPNGGMTLDAWKSKASAVVNETMVDPRFFGREAPRSGRLVVTAQVARDGRILQAEITRSHRNLPLKRATRTFIDKLDRLPPLEGVIQEKRAVVHMHLLYASNKDELAQMRNEVVTLRRIAHQDAKGETLAEAPVIDILPGKL